MKNIKKNLNKKTQSKKKKKGLDHPNEPNTIHAQNEKINNGEVPTGKKEKES